MSSKNPVILTSAEEFIALRNFMVAEGGLGLAGVKAQVYALIYQHSPADALQNDSGCYYGSIDYTTARTGASRRSVISALKELLAEGLIEEKGAHVQGDSTTTKKYIVNRERAEKARLEFAAYWAKKGAENASGAETAPEEKSEQNRAFSGAGIAPGRTGAGAETAPEIPPFTPCEHPGAETAPGKAASGAETSPAQVQKLHPNRHMERQGLDLERQGLDLSCRNSPSPSIPHQPETGEGDGRACQAEAEDPANRGALDPQTAEAVRSLMRRSLNQRAPFDEVAPAYLDALASGYTPEQIERGYAAYIRRYRKKNPATSEYAIRLTNYLTRGDGLRFDEPIPQAEADKCKRRKRQRTALELRSDPTLLALFEAIPTEEDVASGQATQADREAAFARYDDYFDYTEGKPNTRWERELREMLKPPCQMEEVRSA